MYSEINVIVKEPDKWPYEMKINNSADALKKLVGGFPDLETVSDDCAVISNSEALLLQLPHNFTLNGTDYYGTVVFCGFRGEYLIDSPISVQGFSDKFSMLEEPDSHSCSAEVDAYGYCQVCGAIVHGSVADYEEHGYDPPGTY